MQEPNRDKYRQAEECRVLAEQATTEQHRANWLKLAEQWQVLAKATGLHSWSQAERPKLRP